MKFISYILMMFFLSSCYIFSDRECIIVEVSDSSFLNELKGKYGGDRTYYNLRSHNSLVVLKAQESFAAEVITRSAKEVVLKRGVCAEKEIVFIDRYVSLFETGDIDVLFYCS